MSAESPVFHWKAFGVCCVITALLSAIYLPYVPRNLPLFDSQIRTAALQAVVQLRERGYWVTLATMQEVRRSEEEICFDWTYQYRSKTRDFPLESVTTCIDA